jgi:hypothetical protein
VIHRSGSVASASIHWWDAVDWGYEGRMPSIRWVTRCSKRLFPRLWPRPDGLNPNSPDVWGFISTPFAIGSIAGGARALTLAWIWNVNSRDY